MCDNSRTWMYNIMLVAVTLLAVTAPLIQHVTCVANNIPADITSDTVKLLPPTTLIERDVSNVVGSTGSTETYDNLRVPKNGEVDFDAYINEFKMQDEASIPEDILDQQHIQDEDGDVQYGSESEATDIIFESEGFTPNNFTSHVVTKNKNELSNIYKKKHNKTNKRKTNDENPFNEKYNNKREEYYDDIAIVGDELATEYEDNVQQSMDMSSGSDAHKKFKRIKSEQNEQDEHHQQHQQQQQVQEHHQHQERLPDILKLNERKFNRGSVKEEDPVQKTIKNKKTSKHIDKKNGKVEEDKDYNLQENRENVEEKEEKEKNDDDVDDDDDDETAAATIGDIEDSFQNEDEALSTDIKDDTAKREKLDYGYIDRDKSVAATISTNVLSAQRSISVSESGGQMLTSPIVGRKIKRFNRVRTFNSGDRQQAQIQLDDIKHKSHQKVLMNDEPHTDKNNNQHQRLETVKEAKFQNNYEIRDYGIETALRNGSNIFEDIQNTSGQLQYHNGMENFNNDETEAEQTTLEQENVQREKQQKQPEQEQEQAQHESLNSAFEQHKARRRNNRRYGHKSHKKRYKDYLRFAMTPVITKATSTTIDPLAIRNTSQRSEIPKLEVETKQQFATVANRTNAAIEVTLTNNSKRNYENKHEIENTKNFDQFKQTEQRVEKLKKYARKFEAEKSRELPASPIFVVTNRNSVTTGTTKPFYEGQINYFMKTKDDEQTGVEDDNNNNNDNNNKFQTDTLNWYRRVSPVLRNGIKTSLIEGNEPPSEHRRKHHHHYHHHHHPHIQQQHQYQYNPHHQMQREYNHHQNHHYRKHQQQEPHQHQHQHHSHHKHQQTNKHYQSGQSNPYQRKLIKKPLLDKSKESPLYSTPIPPPSYRPHAGAMQELGHQITEMEELERYYAKWPHLARVQLQVYDEHCRELHPELYPDYDQDYESAAELEEAQNGDAEDANLPPYIKKYNRRNKQLLNLLEGTLAPPPPPTTRTQSFRQGHFSSLLQPGPHETSSDSRTVIRIDDDYMKEKRRRYHSRYGNKNNNQHNGFQYDLFAEQRAALNANDSVTGQRNSTEYHVVTTQKPTTITTTTTTTTTQRLQNKIPEEDVSITREEQDDTDWQQEIEMKSNGNIAEMTGNVEMTWQIEKLTTPSAPISSDKSALFRLPSYPAISGTYIGKPRSRSAQFAPSNSGRSNSRRNSFINMHKDYHNFQKTRHMATAMSTIAPELQVSPQSTNIISPDKTINSFVYHRVVDSAPRFVGAGATGLKQRLPFVAITDRRLETAKKSLMEHKQDLEQNFYPMP